MKRVMRFGKKGKLCPQYIGPFRISKRINNVAYDLELPSELVAVHPIFHISMLKKCMDDPSLIVPTESIGIKDNLSYEEIPVEILDRQVHKLRTNEVALVKVLWRNQFVEKATWEIEEDMKKRYPHLFPSEKIPNQGFTDHERNHDPSTYPWFTPISEVVDHGALHGPWTTTRAMRRLVKVRQNLPSWESDHGALHGLWS
ncbi:hypothetical protein MTR67_026929 [Solanum verrucosum]|uniref:Tf2-1-like SH3-like domain-containing protein n=1 Tax=Solanum verrucosum TaxID=315347 RepID=A0AAF0R8P0_SOLVR|nr:hypothetical protein MTR67_026929 [Solanum verrucosum]